MKLLEFQFLQDRIGILVGGSYLDLHNDYRLQSHHCLGRNLRMLWQRLEKDWVRPNQVEDVVLEISGVSYYEVRGELSDCLEEIGFFENDTLGKVQYNGLTAPKPGCEVLVFRFVGGGEIAVRGESACVRMDLV